MDEQQQVMPGGRRGTPLYDRAGTILAAGVLLLLAGLLEIGVAVYLFVVAATTVPDWFQELERALRVIATIFLVEGLAAVVVSGGIVQVRRWARIAALVVGAIALLNLLYILGVTGDPSILMVPNLAVFVAALLLFPGVGAAFRQAKAERALLREQRRARSSARLARAGR
ncbi:MAG TPA: hypothetical protein VGX28_05055 [Frankiaceae bacterium]|jgi:peptidoglycan/LPS O-acetylase OafA/YrhL|nr:hypothetical protein [Frankiaceae bacterium]